jgi:hypothetical protein
MSDRELRGVSAEDLEMFQAFVADHYRLPWEQSYVELTREIEGRFGRRSTNRIYRTMLEGEMHDLVMAVVIRYAKVHGSMRRAGQKIESFDAMLENRVGHVYKEALRRYGRQLRDINPDDYPDLPDPNPGVDWQLEEGEERLILLKCRLECLRKLPRRISDIFLEYYDQDCPPAERAEMRIKLALRLEGSSADRATPEEREKAKGNLDSKMSKWRANNLRPCELKCLRRAASRR